MSRSPMRRVATAATAAALATAGVLVGVGAGTGVASAATCSATSHLTQNNGVGMTMTYDKTVSPTSVAVGGGAQTVTYSIVVGTTNGAANPYVSAITDFPPAGFGAPTAVTVSAYHILQGQQTANVTATPAANGGYEITNAGWFVNSGNSVTANFTYAVPSNVTLGQTVTSGGANVTGTEGVSNNMPNLTSCFAVGAPNAGQAVTGSLNNNGLGSSQGGLSSTGSISDILGNAIGQGIAHQLGNN